MQTMTRMQGWLGRKMMRYGTRSAFRGFRMAASAGMRRNRARLRRA